MNTPRTANTSSSSVDDVQSDSGSGSLAGDRRVLLVHRLDLAAVDAAVLVDVVDEHLRGRLLVATREVDEVA